MSFGAPLNLFWIIPAAGAILALYMLRRPRRNISVPSTLLWRAIPEQSVRVRRLQKLTPNLLLFLQILAALLIVGAAAQPQIRRAVPPGRLWVVIVDNGASMKAVDVAGGRLAAAKQKVEQIAGGLRAGDRACVVETAPAKLVSEPSTDRDAVAHAIEAAPATDVRSDLPASVSLAAAALEPAARAGQVGGIVLVSDGAWPASDDAAVVKAAGQSPLSLVTVPSGDAENMGIARLSVERDPLQPQRALQALVEVHAFGFGDDKQTARLSLDESGRAIAEQTVSVAPGASSTAVFHLDAPASSAPLTASLAPSGRDDLESDNGATVILPAAGSTKVLLFSDGDPPLERALNLLPGVQVDESGLANLAAVGAPSGYDLYVLDGAAPSPRHPLPGSALIWGAGGPQFTPTSDSTPDLGPVTDWDRSHPSMRFVDLSQTQLKSAAWSSVGAWEPLIENSSGIVAAAQEEGNRRTICLNFSAKDSGFAKDPSFPIFISNAVAWLTQTGGQSEVAGTPIALAPVANGWTVTGPNGAAISGLCDQHGSACSDADTNSAGVYSARGGGQTLLFARTVDPAGSDISPKEHRIAVGASAVSGIAAGATDYALANITLWAAALCLALLGVEWWVYHRRQNWAAAGLRSRA